MSKKPYIRCNVVGIKDDIHKILELCPNIVKYNNVDVYWDINTGTVALAFDTTKEKEKFLRGE